MKTEIVTQEPGLVSIIIPAYRAFPLVKETLASIAAQEHHAWEVILVEDGSDDGTRGVLEEFAAAHPGHTVLYHRHEKSGGCAAGRNSALARAKGDYIALLDADDLWTPHHLRLSLAALRDLPQGAVFCDVQKFERLPERLLEVWGPSPEEIADFPASLFFTNYITPSAVVFSRGIYETVGSFDDTLRAAEDHDYWIRILRAGFPFLHRPEITCYYRKSQPQALTGSFVRLIQAEAEVVVKHRHWQANPAQPSRRHAAYVLEVAARHSVGDGSGYAASTFLRAWRLQPGQFRYLGHAVRAFFASHRRARPVVTRALVETGRALFILQHHLPAPLRKLAEKLSDACDQQALAQARYLPPAAAPTAPPVLELHSLLCRRDLSMFLWALDSFHHHFPLSYRVVVHDDGSLRPEECSLLQLKNPRIQVVSRAAADRAMAAWLAPYPALHAYREKTIWGLKLLDFHRFAEAPYVLALDADILFFKPALELAGIIERAESCVYYMNDGHPYSRRVALQERFGCAIDGFNAGMLLYPKGFFPLPEMNEIAEWILAHPKEVDRVDDQVIYSILAAHRPHAEFSAAYSALGPAHPARQDLGGKHYHSCAKKFFSLEGLRHALSRPS